MPEPRDLAAEIEAGVALPPGNDERFSGYGVMAVPFASGHILCLRRFPATSIGAAYTSVWLREPDGRWTFYQNAPPLQACPRYFGGAIAAAEQREIELTWPGPRNFTVRVAGEDGIDWGMSLAPSPATRALNAIGGLMPDALWHNRAVLRVMSAVAGVALGAGRLRMAGRAPNGQRFIANPRRIWRIVESRAIVRGADIGPIGRLPEQVRLGDFWIPNAGIFVIGQAFFEPFEEARHQAAATSDAS